MKRIIRVLILLFFLSGYVFAQELNWKHLNGPMGGTIGDLAINSKGEIFAGVYGSIWGYSGIYKSTDNGETWEKIKHNFITDFAVFSIYITKDDHIWVGTDHQYRIYRSTDNGETWEIKNNGYATNECWAFGESNDRVLFAGDGHYNRIFRSTNYGDSWQLVAYLQPLVFATDANNVVYTGTFTGLYSTTDNGLTWYPDNFLQNIAVSAILIDDNNIFCGTGYMYNYLGGNGVFYSSNGGQNWVQLGLAGKVVLSLAFDSDGNLFAGTQNDGLFKTTDMGQTWVQYQSGLYRQQVFRLKINKNDNIFVGSEGEFTQFSDGGIFRSIDSGKTFKQVGLPISNIKNIVFSGDSLIFAATPSGVQKYNRITKEWREMGLYKVEALSITQNEIIYAATLDEGLYKSTDLGQNWLLTKLTIDTLFPVNNVLAINDDTVFAVASYGGLRRTFDGGQNWDILSINATTLIFVNGTLWVTRASVLYKSTDLGSSFTPIYSGFGFTDGLFPLAITKNDYVFLVSSTPFGLMRSTNAGLNWNQILFDMRFTTVYANTNGVVITGTSGPGFWDTNKVYISYNYGNNWSISNQPTGVGVPLSDIKQDFSDNFFFATSSQGLYEGDIILRIENSPITIGFYSLSQNYPNPFNPSTVIGYQLPVSGNVTLKVFDVLGREVATLVNEYKEAGRHNYQFSIVNHQLPSGVYFYRLNAGSFSETKKMILLR